MTINDNKLLVVLGDHIYAAMRLADLIGQAGPIPPYFEQVVTFPLGNALDYLRTVTKGEGEDEDEGDVSNN